MSSTTVTRRAVRWAAFGMALAAMVTPPLRAQQDANAILSHAVSAYSRVTTARGTFEQTLTNPLTGTTAAARGEFVQERPSHLAVRFTDPSGDRIVADGKWVWVYAPSATPGQVVRMPVADQATGGASSVDFIAEFLTGPAGRFDVSAAVADTVAGRQTHAIVLVPREAEQFTRAKLWVDDADGVVRQFEVTDASGTLRHVRLTKVAFNVPVDRSAFAFTPPPGVKVVDQATLLNGTS
jgi:outer membrane lipoprotein carrier protein